MEEEDELLFDFFDPEFLSPTVVLLVNAIISRAKKEPLDAKEEKAVVSAVSKVAKKRLSSEWLKKHGDLVNLAVVLGGVAIKRVDLEKLMKGDAKQDTAHPGTEG